MAKKKIYYESETDDFSRVNINTQELGKNFKYQSDRSFCFRFAGFTLYHFVKPLVSLAMFVSYGGKIVNKKIIKKYNKTGCFIYGNHTGGMIDAFQPNRLRKNKNYIVTSKDAISIKGLKNIVLMLGGIPLSDSYKLQKSFIVTLEDCMNKKQSVTIYPEAHIWPYYTGVRNFPSASFSYPIKFNVPCFAMTTTYQKRKFSNKVKVTTFIDGPFFPDQNLPLKQAKEKLRDEIYNAMLIRTKIYSTYSYYEYKKKENLKKYNKEEDYIFSPLNNEEDNQKVKNSAN